MKEKRFLFILLFLVTLKGYLQAIEQDKVKSVRQLTLPFLHSLKIVKDEKAIAGQKTLFCILLPKTIYTGT